MSMKSIRGKGALAGIALVVGCAACCALPILATIGLGGVAATALGWMTNNLIAVVGVFIGAIFVGALVARFAARRRAESQRHEAACSEFCKTDRSCCD